MSAEPPRDRALLQQWQAMIRRADRHNVFCHCQHCDYEWVTSTRKTGPCPHCGSARIECLACWQFPDG